MRNGRVRFVKAAERRNEIIKLLEATDQPVNATQLAELLSVSRQVIVGDIALIRAKGIEILATPRGYLSANAFKGEGSLFTGKNCLSALASRHSHGTEHHRGQRWRGRGRPGRASHLWHLDRRIAYPFAP